jgi:dTDP-4-amino-4,6-dideoxy-D-galactose acyltransferase
MLSTKLSETELQACELLPWDSEFFGFRIARLRAGFLTEVLAEEALQWSREEGIRCLYFLSAGDHPGTRWIAETSRFQLVDARTTLSRGIGSSNYLGEYSTIRPFEPGDTAALEQIARESHRETRFYNDPQFDRRRCDDLYATWIRRSCEGWADEVFVAGFVNAPAGYITCHLDADGTGSIGLVAVDSNCRGQGIGRQLLLAALTYFKKSGMREVKVVTQGRNQDALNLYVRCGFEAERTEMWYHRWFREGR